MNTSQFSIKQIIVLITLTALVIVVWQWNLRPSRGDRLSQTLLKAVEQSDLESAERAIGLGADVDPETNSLLAVAVNRKDRPMIDMLLAKGAIPQRALHAVLRSGDAILLEDFAKRSVIPSWNDVKTLIRNADLDSLQLILPHIASIKDSNNGTYEPYLEGYGDGHGWERLLFYAVSAPDSCRHELIELLLKDQAANSLIALEYAAEY